MCGAPSGALDVDAVPSGRRIATVSRLQRTGVESGQDQPGVGGWLARRSQSDAAALADGILHGRVVAAAYDPSSNRGGLSSAHVGMRRHSTRAPTAVGAAPDM